MIKEFTGNLVPVGRSTPQEHESFGIAPKQLELPLEEKPSED